MGRFIPIMRRALSRCPRCSWWWACCWLADAAITLLWKEPLSAHLRAGCSRASSTTGWPSSRAPSRPRPTARCSRTSTASTASSPTRRARSTGAPTTGSRWAASGCARSASNAVVVAGTDTAAPAARPGPLPRHAAAGRARHGGDRRAPHDLRRAGSGGSTSSTPATRSSCRCRTGASPTPSSSGKIVPPTATWVTHRVGYDRLVLSACHPLYSAAKRIVVFAKLVRTKPRNDRLA